MEKTCQGGIQVDKNMFGNSFWEHKNTVCVCVVLSSYGGWQWQHVASYVGCKKHPSQGFLAEIAMMDLRAAKEPKGYPNIMAKYGMISGTRLW